MGQVLVHRSPRGLSSGRIVETEAYYGRGDPASRASRGKTKLNELMWGPGGYSFIYMVHGRWLFNITAEREGVPGAVLVRALEPLEGLELMLKRRRVPRLEELTSGPGKLTQAMGITREQHGLDLTRPRSPLRVEPGEGDFEVASSHRVGVSADLDRELRFFIPGNRFVSR